MKKILLTSVILFLNINISLADTSTVDDKKDEKQNNTVEDLKKIDEVLGISAEDFYKISQNYKNNKLSALDKFDMIMDEKKRLKYVENRRIDDGETSLNKNYIRNTTYTDHVKGLMREASFYIDYIIKNYNNIENIKKEANNIGWNATCLSGIIKQDTEIIFNMLQVTLFDQNSEEERRYHQGDQLVMKILSENNDIASFDEINLRCYEVYNNKNVNPKN